MSAVCLIDKLCEVRTSEGRTLTGVLVGTKERTPPPRTNGEARRPENTLGLGLRIALQLGVFWNPSSLPQPGHEGESLGTVRFFL